MLRQPRFSLFKTFVHLTEQHSGHVAFTGRYVRIAGVRAEACAQTGFFADHGQLFVINLKILGHFYDFMSAYHTIGVIEEKLALGVPGD